MKAGYEASPDQLAWSNTIYVAETDAKAMREAKPHLEALVNRFLKMPAEMLLPPGYSTIEATKRVRAHKVTGKTMSIEELNKTGVVIVGSPNDRARKARRVSGPRRLQHVTDQDPVRHAARRHDARQHDGDRGGDSAGVPRAAAAGEAGGAGGGVSPSIGQEAVPVTCVPGASYIAQMLRWLAGALT